MNNLLIDIDGNQYKTAQIGNQVWMAENLKVRHFRNGEPILISRDRSRCESHINSKKSAVYISEEDNSEYLKYGFLYSPEIMFDERNLAPEGWHIPTLLEWKELVRYLGGADVAGRKLKSSQGWKRESNQPPTYGYKICEFGGTNDFGFSALPSGMMESCYQNAIDVGMYAWYWAADKHKSIQSRTRYGYFNLNYYKGNSTMACSPINKYLAIRCIKDL